LDFFNTKEKSKKNQRKIKEKSKKNPSFDEMQQMQQAASNILKNFENYVYIYIYTYLIF
jgi:hypothetical protein